ncbi:hypothetical protein KIL84_007528 [Mauremys mutica]|uniref:Pyrin domain-containing protein n=1 Tax=Mauremys mutica TaxID=74926 RepID=A0A9D3X389_9SAUR|nr:hypothetical protein KIL84_007528 [Mauremys mutica]
MAKTLRDHLLMTLEDLGEDELKKFKFKLHEMPLKEGYEHIGRGTLKKADAIDLTDKLISCYEGNYAVEVTVEALKSINEMDLAEKLTKATGNDALNSKQEPDTQQGPGLEEKALLKVHPRERYLLVKRKQKRGHETTEVGQCERQHPKFLYPYSRYEYAHSLIEDVTLITFTLTV